MIRLMNTNDPYFHMGKMDSALFGKEIDVMIEKEAPMDYAQRCAQSVNSLSNTVIQTVCRRVLDYRAFMLEEWNEEFADQIRAAVPDSVTGSQILAYVDTPCLVVNRPEGEGVGYTISGCCPWEPEHGIEIILKDDVLLYVGPQNCLGPWAEADEYWVIY